MSDQVTSTQGAAAPSQSDTGSQQAQQLFGGGAPETGGGASAQGQQQAASVQSGGPVAPPPATQGLTTEQLRELVSSTAREAVQAARPEPTMTQEQVNQMLNVYQVPPQTAMRIAKALGITELAPEAQQEFVAALNEMLDAKTRQAVTMAAVQLEALKRNDLAGIRQQLSPVLKFAQQQEETRLRDAFLTAHPDMKGYEPVLEMIYQQMVAEKAQFRTEAEAFKAVHDRARQVLAKLPGQNGQQQQQQQPQGGKSRMSTVSMGGQGGGQQAAGGQTDSEKLARRLFGSTIG